MSAINKAAATVLAILCVIGLTTACMQSRGQDADAQNANDEEQPALAVEDGVLIQQDEANGRWLITQYVDGGDSPYVDAFWFTLRDDTTLTDEQGAPVSQGNLQVGQRVEAWSIGPIKESYPQQAGLARLIVLERQTPDDGMIGEEAAVQTALNESGSSRIWAVKSTAWDADRGVWSVELAEGGHADQTSVVHVSGADGKPVPAVVMENDAFRLFAPAPESEVGSSFTVAGEARVFEAAFSWTLEDGHSILAEGHAMADQGAPEWGRFEFEVAFEKASNPVLTLILYVGSAKDGSPEHELYVPLKPKKELIDYQVD